MRFRARVTLEAITMYTIIIFYYIDVTPRVFDSCVGCHPYICIKCISPTFVARRVRLRQCADDVTAVIHTDCGLVVMNVVHAPHNVTAAIAVAVAA